MRGSINIFEEMKKYKNHEMEVELMIRSEHIKLVNPITLYIVYTREEATIEVELLHYIH